MWLKRGSLVAVFALLLLFIVLFDIQKRITVSFYALLPESSSKEALLIYQKIEKSQEVILAANGTRFDEILQKISILKGYETLGLSPQMSDFTNKYLFYLQDAPTFLPNDNEVYEKLSKLKSDLLNGFRFGVNKNDPLSLFLPHENHISAPHINGFEYTSVFRLNIMPEEYEQYYDELHKIAGETYLFSPFFYQVENSRAFKFQAKFILGLSAAILGLLYIYWLRKPSLLFFSCLTLLSSTAFAQLVAGMIWREISLFSLIFSAAVSTISIDYMFHYYLHDMYGNKKGFSKPVFYGFSTTFIAFIALGFVNFTLISQIAITAASSLLFAYMCFVFIYPHLKFGDAKLRRFKFKTKNLLSYSSVCICSILIILSSVFWIKFDFDIKSLDVKNSNLEQKQELLSQSLDNQTIILISANTLDELIEKSKTLKEGFAPISLLLSQKEYKEKYGKLSKLDFASLRKNIAFHANKLGFKNGFFDDAYSDKMLVLPPPIYTDEFLNDNILKVTKSKDKIYAVGFYDKGKANLLNDDNILAVDSVSLFQKELKNVAKELVIVAIFIAFLIVSVIVFFTKRDFMRAFSFVLTPLATCSLIFIFIPINVLHIFMLVIVLATSVDYGIYSVCSNKERTNEAIHYSLFSTIAGFGVLAFSSILALQAIGITALCATFSIMALLYFSKVKI
jgi:predicted exporter